MDSQKDYHIKSDSTPSWTSRPSPTRGPGRGNYIFLFLSSLYKDLPSWTIDPLFGQSLKRIKTTGKKHDIYLWQTLTRPDASLSPGPPPGADMRDPLLHPGRGAQVQIPCAFVTLSQFSEFTSCHLINVNNGLSMYFTIVLTHNVFLPLCAFISSVLIFNSIVYLILIFWLFLVFDSIDLGFCYFCSYVELFGTFLFHSFSDDHN